MFDTLVISFQAQRAAGATVHSDPLSSSTIPLPSLQFTPSLSLAPLGDYSDAQGDQERLLEELFAVNSLPSEVMRGIWGAKGG